MRKEPWSRGERIAAWTLGIAVVAILASFFIPEVRQFFHLEKPPQTAQAETTPSAATQSTPPVQTEPSRSERSKPDTSKPKKTQKPTKVQGNDNVAGNNISGDNNVTGNNNQTGPTANAPNGIAIAGGTVTNPTVNNYAPASRRLSNEQKTMLVACLKSNPGTFTVSAISNNAEAYQYASDFSGVFTSAGWKNEQPIPVAIIMIAGGMWTGVRISVHGTWDDTTKTTSLTAGAPETTGLDCLRAAKFGAAAIPYKDMATGSVRMDVSERPQ
jgi:cytoskeletal protein RodZ